VAFSPNRSNLASPAVESRSQAGSASACLVTAKYTQSVQRLSCYRRRDRAVRLAAIAGSIFDIVETVKALGIAICGCIVMSLPHHVARARKCTMMRSGTAIRRQIPVPSVSLAGKTMWKQWLDTTGNGTGALSHPGPIGPIGRKNNMETKTWHHRKWDGVLSHPGPIGPIWRHTCASAERTQRLPAIPGHLGYLCSARHGKAHGKQMLGEDKKVTDGAVASGYLGYLRSNCRCGSPPSPCRPRPAACRPRG